VGANAAAAVVKCHARTLPRQLAGDPFANADPGAGHQRRAPVQRQRLHSLNSFLSLDGIH
jgi:hypothetical protein